MEGDPIGETSQRAEHLRSRRHTGGGGVGGGGGVVGLILLVPLFASPQNWRLWRPLGTFRASPESSRRRAAY
eukprot:7313546-Pyramimonas_sp.AAC.1